MDRRHFIGQSAAAVGLVAGLSNQAKAANLQKAEILVIGGGYGGATVVLRTYGDTRFVAGNAVFR